MKKSLLMSFQTLFVSALFMVGCSSSIEEVIEPETPMAEKNIQVSFDFSGEVLNITESPLSRASEGAKDWYAFQVYSIPENADATMKYEPYAYGFFDNTADMKISLMKGYKYKFDVCMVVDVNSFYLSSNEFVRYMYAGYLYLKNPKNTYDRPNVDRFFGSVEYEPTENGVVDIDMKRVSFGVKFEPTNFTEGSLEFSVEGAPVLKLAADEGTEVQDIISFKNLEQAYNSSVTDIEYSENIPVNITWVKGDGARVPIASQPVEFKRNKLTTIEFKVEGSSSNSSFELGTEGEELGDGGTVTVGGEETNTGTNTEVTPEENPEENPNE